MQKCGALTPLKDDSFRPLWASTPDAHTSPRVRRAAESEPGNGKEQPCELKESTQHEGAAAITERTDASKG